MKRGWMVSVFDQKDKPLYEKRCSSLDDVAKLFGKKRACDLSHLIYKENADKKREIMLKRWNVGLS